MSFVSQQNKTIQQQSEQTQPFLRPTTICTSRLGSGLSIAIITCPLSLACCVPSTSIPTSGAIEVEFTTCTFYCAAAGTFTLDPMDALELVDSSPLVSASIDLEVSF